MRDKRKIVKAILEYDRQVHGKGKNLSIDFAGEKFAKDKEANEFLMKNPNAFLFGVIFDQGILAEKAWSAPYKLKVRLGHFDLKKMVSLGPKRLKDKISQKPALHRYNYLGEWIYEASKKLLAEYDGDAFNIWGGTPSAKETREKLKEFKGIGQKKANMALRILSRVFKIPFENLEVVDVPYDIHVRRVFLRAGLAKKDTINTITEAARVVYPKEPSRLDVVWHIGRNFCHSRNPACVPCPLRKVCPKIGAK